MGAEREKIQTLTLIKENDTGPHTYTHKNRRSPQFLAWLSSGWLLLRTAQSSCTRARRLLSSMLTETTATFLIQTTQWYLFKGKQTNAHFIRGCVSFDYQALTIILSSR